MKMSLYQFLNVANSKARVFENNDDQTAFEVVFQYFQYKLRYILAMLLISITLYPIYLPISIILAFFGHWEYLLTCSLCLVFNILVHQQIIRQLKVLALKHMASTDLLKEILQNEKFLKYSAK
jgi:hypothetical protein